VRKCPLFPPPSFSLFRFNSLIPFVFSSKFLRHIQRFLFLLHLPFPHKVHLPSQFPPFLLLSCLLIWQNAPSLPGSSSAYFPRHLKVSPPHIFSSVFFSHPDFFFSFLLLFFFFLSILVPTLPLGLLKMVSSLFLMSFPSFF